MEVYSLETQLRLLWVPEGQLSYTDFAPAYRHGRRSIAFVVKRRSNIHNRLDPGKRGNSALEQVRHPAHGHHRPGHYEKIAYEGDQIPCRNGPGYSQTSPENQHQQHAEVRNEARYREKHSVDKRKFEIVAHISFTHLGKALDLMLLLVVGFYQANGGTGSSGQIRSGPKTVPGLS